MQIHIIWSKNIQENKRVDQENQELTRTEEKLEEYKKLEVGLMGEALGVRH